MPNPITPDEAVAWLKNDEPENPEAFPYELGAPNPAVLLALPLLIEAARAATAPPTRRDFSSMFRPLNMALPPQFGLDEASALPVYWQCLSDLPVKSLRAATNDLLRTMTRFPTIADIRKAAEPHVAAARAHLDELEKLHAPLARAGFYDR